MKKSPDFSRLSSFYDLLGTLMFQGSLHSSQVYFLNKLQKSDKALVLGGGTGKFLVDLLNSGKVERVSYVDISPGMIAKAKGKVKKIGFEDKVEFICGGLESVPAGKYDLICTHYFLDCFGSDKVGDVIDNLKNHLTKTGVWHFTDFYLDAESTLLRKKFVAFLYCFFRISCGLKVDRLSDFERLFNDAGLKEKETKFFRKRLLRSALYEI